MVPRKPTFGAGRKYGFRARTFVQEILVPPSFRIRARSGDSRTLLLEVPGCTRQRGRRSAHPPVELTTKVAARAGPAASIPIDTAVNRARKQNPRARAPCALMGCQPPNSAHRSLSLHAYSLEVGRDAKENGPTLQGYGNSLFLRSGRRIPQMG